jgi:hypothetical protein
MPFANPMPRHTISLMLTHADSGYDLEDWEEDFVTAFRIRRSASTVSLLLSKDVEIAQLKEEIARLQLLDQIHRFEGNEDMLRQDRQKWHNKFLRVHQIAKDERLKVEKQRETIIALEAQLKQHCPTFQDDSKHVHIEELHMQLAMKKKVIHTQQKELDDKIKTVDHLEGQFSTATAQVRNTELRAEKAGCDFNALARMSLIKDRGAAVANLSQCP